MQILEQTKRIRHSISGKPIKQLSFCTWLWRVWDFFWYKALGFSNYLLRYGSEICWHRFIFTKLVDRFGNVITCSKTKKQPYVFILVFKTKEFGNQISIIFLISKVPECNRDFLLQFSVLGIVVVTVFFVARRQLSETMTLQENDFWKELSKTYVVCFELKGNEWFIVVSC